MRVVRAGWHGCQVSLVHIYTYNDAAHPHMYVCMHLGGTTCNKASLFSLFPTEPRGTDYRAPTPQRGVHSSIVGVPKVISYIVDGTFFLLLSRRRLLIDFYLLSKVVYSSMHIRLLLDTYSLPVL